MRKSVVGEIVFVLEGFLQTLLSPPKSSWIILCMFCIAQGDILKGESQAESSVPWEIREGNLTKMHYFLQKYCMTIEHIHIPNSSFPCSLAHIPLFLLPFIQLFFLQFTKHL